MEGVLKSLSGRGFSVANKGRRIQKVYYVYSYTYRRVLSISQFCERFELNIVAIHKKSIFQL